MQRISCEERPDWRARAEEIGFDFHTLHGQRYWDERAYYAFTLKEIEQDLEAPTAELEKMSRELVARIIADERLMRRARNSGAVLELDCAQLEEIRTQPLWSL
jgi:glutathionylspermidine synthase